MDQRFGSQSLCTPSQTRQKKIYSIKFKLEKLIKHLQLKTQHCVIELFGQLYSVTKVHILCTALCAISDHNMNVQYGAHGCFSVTTTAVMSVDHGT